MSREAQKPDPGVAEEIAHGIRRVLAANPGPMTHWGTNTYIVGTGEVAIVDPGPEDPAHLDALAAAVAGTRVAAILVTHAHRDHCAGAHTAATRFGVPVLAYGEPAAGRSDLMVRFAASGGIGGGEGVDEGFHPDRPLHDGEVIQVAGIAIEVLHTPGHFGGHLAFAIGDVVLTGDHVMAWSTTLISPPDGDVQDFIASCRRLRVREDRVFLPGHGPPVPEPAARLDGLIAHRLAREDEVRAILADGPASAADIARSIYRDLPPGLMPAARRNVLAHLLDLHHRGEITATPAPITGAVWALE